MKLGITSSSVEKKVTMQGKKDTSIYVQKQLIFQIGRFESYVLVIGCWTFLKSFYKPNGLSTTVSDSYLWGMNKEPGYEFASAVIGESSCRCPSQNLEISIPSN